PAHRGTGVGQRVEARLQPRGGGLPAALAEAAQVLAAGRPGRQRLRRQERVLQLRADQRVRRRDRSLQRADGVLIRRCSWQSHGNEGPAPAGPFRSSSVRDGTAPVPGPAGARRLASAAAYEARAAGSWSGSSTTNSAPLPGSPELNALTDPPCSSTNWWTMLSPTPSPP